MLNKIFSSLKSLGFNDVDNVELYSKEEKEKKSKLKEDKKNEIDIRTLLYDKKVKCPVDVYKRQYYETPSKGREVVNGDNHTYLISFSEAIDTLPMWVQYSKDGTGCCLLLKKEFFDEKEDIKVIGLSLIHI